tara:strand:+ start:152 stop:1219 length:1068 start_codon:yes stop_codon:yes gene_type:complete
MSQITGATENPTNIFQQTTDDETQSLKDNPKFNVVYKGHMTRSTILETKYPGDSGVQELTVDGPGDNFIIMDSRSRITIRTGPRNPAIGAGSGALNINAGGGGLWKFEERLDCEFNMGGDNEDKQALNLAVNGNMVVDASGDDITIKGNNITLIAGNVLTLKGQSIVMNANDGQGSVRTYAGIVQTVADTRSDFITGQEKLRNFGEVTHVQYDPRGTTNIISMGHVNRKIYGDYEFWNGGITSMKSAGTVSMIPLVLNRLDTYKITTGIGNVSIDPSGSFFVNAKLNAEIEALATMRLETTGGSFKLKGAGTSDIDAKGGINIDSMNDINIETPARVKIKGTTEVAIDSAQIYLN